MVVVVWLFNERRRHGGGVARRLLAPRFVLVEQVGSGIWELLRFSMRKGCKVGGYGRAYNQWLRSEGRRFRWWWRLIG